MNPRARSALPDRTPAFELFPVLDRNWPGDGIGPVAVIIAQLPDPAELPEGELVVVRESHRPRRGVGQWIDWAKRLLRKPRKADAAVRCTALLARGYREIGAARDPRTGEELVWGLAPISGRPSEAP